MRNSFPSLFRAILPVLAVSFLPVIHANADDTARATTPTDWQPVVIPNARQRDITSRHTGKTYRIFVAVPKITPPEKGWPVLYTLDGNSSFALAEPAVRRLSQRAGAGIHSGVVVSIGYPTENLLDLQARAEDYTPPAPDLSDTGDQSGYKQGGADKFLRFLETELKPLIESEFKIDKTRQTLFGHSYGGLFTLYTLFNSPDSFQNYVAASPSIWWNKRYILGAKERFLESQADKKIAVRVLLTVGETEEKSDNPARSSMVRDRRQVGNARELGAELKAKGFDARFWEIPGANHGTAMPPALQRALEMAFATARN